MAIGRKNSPSPARGEGLRSRFEDNADHKP